MADVAARVLRRLTGQSTVARVLRQPAILSGLKGQYLTLINAAPGLASYSLTPNGPADYPALDLVYTANRSGSQIFFDLTGDPAVAGSQILYVADASMAAPTASSMLMFAPGDVVAAAAAAGIDPATIQVITVGWFFGIERARKEVQRGAEMLGLVARQRRGEGIAHVEERL